MNNTPLVPDEITRQSLSREAAERRQCVSRRESDPVRISFDWEPLALDEPNLVIFRIDIRRQDQESSVRFGIDLGKLSQTETEQLHAFLSRRHAGTSDAYDVSWHLSWLLETWLTQVQPKLTRVERRPRYGNCCCPIVGLDAENSELIPGRLCSAPG